MADKFMVRSRFMAALAEGKSFEEATVFANKAGAPTREKADLPPPPEGLATGKKPGRPPKTGK